MVTKRIRIIRDKEFRRLVTDSSCCKKNFVIKCNSRCVSQMTNSRIFKNSICNKAMTVTFAASYRKNFRCLKLYLKLIGQELLLFGYHLKNQSLKFKFSTEALFQVLSCWSSQQKKILLKEAGTSTYQLETLVILKIKIVIYFLGTKSPYKKHWLC